MNWNPAEDQLQEWIPKGGWNPALSEQEKIKAVHLFFFFRRKRYPPPQAESLVHMALWKQKYPTLLYSEDQERILSKALQPLSAIQSQSTLAIRSAAT